jgi:hypothetical protein
MFGSRIRRFSAIRVHTFFARIRILICFAFKDNSKLKIIIIFYANSKLFSINILKNIFSPQLEAFTVKYGSILKQVLIGTLLIKVRSGDIFYFYNLKKYSASTYRASYKAHTG